MKGIQEQFHETGNVLRLLLILPLLFGLTFATVLFSGCVFDTSGRSMNDCCPDVIAFQSSYDWICPSSCPGGGLTEIDYTVEFKDKHKEACEPSNLNISVRNVTDNIDLPAYTFSPETGIYQGRLYLTLFKDTEFALNATTIDCSGNAQQTLMVHVVEDGSYLTVVRNGKLTYPDMIFTSIPVNAGPGVKVDKVGNANPFAIIVIKDGTPDTIPVGVNGTVLRGQDAAGYWSIGLTNEKDLSVYNQLANPNLTMNIYLKCSCNS
jgi:hypothetical protein